ncbi:MAG: BamA/TamA family outer membrane protein [Bacteroidetes bacterium]|nr:BamA/TamA family outer membrane protein [Bacteroidota bacterium]
MPKFVILFVLTFSPYLLRAQKAIDRRRQIDTTGKRDLIDVGKSVLNIHPSKIDSQSHKAAYFSFLPISYSVPGGGTALFTATNFAFYTGDRNSTYLSTVTFTPYLNFSKRFGLPLRSNIWTNNNEWVIQGDTRFLVYPQNTWGLGGQQPEFNKFVVNHQYIRFYQSALKRVTPYFYVGAGYNLDYYLDIETDNPNALQRFTGYPYGTSSDMNSFSSGITLNALYDTRNNDLNPMPGSYINVVYRMNFRALGSDANWRSLFLDMRKYVSLTGGTEKNVLAFWTYYWKTFGNGIPYLSLPSIGWDPYQHSGRGIQQNRYRGNALVYFETEYRRDILSNGLLGMVVFANVNSVSQPVTGNFAYWHPAGGAGLRVKFNKKSDTNITIDYGFSEGYRAVILGLGEAF